MAAVWLAFCAAAGAQTPSAPPNQQPASISGVVRDSVTGAPILRAHVTLRPNFDSLVTTPDTYGAMTDAEGKFSITSVAPATYTVMAERIGFSTAPMMRPMKLNPGDKKDDLKVELIPNGAIIGHVLDSQGEPVEGASLTVEGGGMSGGYGITTDEKGQFRIGGLRAGKYRVRAKSPNLPIQPEIRTDGTAEVHYASTYYPSSLTARGATSVTVTPGSEVSDIDVRLLRVPLVRVSGTVTGYPKSAENVTISATRPGGGENNSAQLKPDGSFELWRLDPGHYTVVARQFSNGQNLQTAPVEIEVAGSNIDHVDLRVVMPFEVSGVVQFEDEQAKPQPPPQQTQTAQGGRQGQPRPAPSARVSLIEVNGLNMQIFGRQQPATVGADGSFTFPQLVAGRYRVELSWNNAYVKSVQLGSVQMEGRILDLLNGSGGAPVTVVASSAVAELSGVVRNGDDPAPAMRVQLIADPSDGRPYYGLTKADGTYGISGIPPGKYKIAIAGSSEMPVATGIGADDLEDAMEISLAPGDKVTKDLKVPPKAK
ncbi:MAG TPA: carboxypeptidase-like regulatory domain-containing protein [Bryobacteraceae bacterium]|nr:carboxypeptidase-like regulatory domain-containing protein [Bryobacteraceae bacterium]